MKKFAALTAALALSSLITCAQAAPRTLTNLTLLHDAVDQVAGSSSIESACKAVDKSNAGVCASVLIKRVFFNSDYRPPQTLINGKTLDYSSLLFLSTYVYTRVALSAASIVVDVNEADYGNALYEQIQQLRAGKDGEILLGIQMSRNPAGSPEYHGGDRVVFVSKKDGNVIYKLTASEGSWGVCRASKRYASGCMPMRYRFKDKLDTDMPEADLK